MRSFSFLGIQVFNKILCSHPNLVFRAKIRIFPTKMYNIEFRGWLLYGKNVSGIFQIVFLPLLYLNAISLL